MASDGCQTPEWTGRPLSHLFYAPNFRSQPSQSYAQQREQQSPGTGGQAPAGGNGSVDFHYSKIKGAWFGPAPTGFQQGSTGPSQWEKAEAEREARLKAGVQREADTVLLRGGAKMPLVGLGTYALTQASAVTKAIELGYRSIDCAMVYGNEAMVGEGIKAAIAAGTVARSDLFVTSKLWNDCKHSAEEIEATCRKSIADLGVEYLDLYLVHWPLRWAKGQAIPTDSTVPAEDTSALDVVQTWKAMEALVEKGLVKSIGVSNHSLSQVEAILAECKVHPVCNQIELHPMLPRRKMVGVCLRKGVQCVAYSPVARNRPEIMDTPQVQTVAKETGKTPAQVVLKWNVQRGVPVIPKAGSEEHIKENIDMFSWRLSPAQKSMLDELSTKPPLMIVDHAWSLPCFENFEGGGAGKASEVFKY
ncbi:unnamed protein product [Pedinophyceae sp. YPF-701]|nr:unnamed protein product [Pedinophyceae sp. YPF-701]